MSFYTIPGTLSFADTLAQFCDDMAVAQNISVSDIKIYLPTRRGIRNLQESFLQLSQGKPRILPIMQPIGDADLEEAMIASYEGMADIPPAIDPVQRQIMLARFLEKVWPHDYNFTQAMSVAQDLAHLIDQIHTEGKNIDNLSEVLEVKELAQYWELTTKFLNTVIGEIWPQYLNNIGMIDGGLHRTKRIQALADYYAQNSTQNPVIIAGSTGSIPATRSLIQSVHGLDNGHIILPALDTVMDDLSWVDVVDGHPQALLKTLISTCKVKRADVEIINPDKVNHDRQFLMSEMMRPATRTRAWQELHQNKNIANGLNGITICEGENDHHEAMIIALSMVEIAADPEQKKTATLITPDRYLAMRVQACLKQWGIDIDDSGGTSLTNTPIGQFMTAIARVLVEGQAMPIALLSVLKNPFMGDEDGKTRNAVRAMEKEILRGVRPFGDLKDWIKLSEKNQEFLTKLSNIFEPFDAFQNADMHNVSDMVRAHILIAESLAKTADDDGANRLWRHDDGEAMAQFLTQMISYADAFPPMRFFDYTQLIQDMMAKQTYTAKYGKHPRLSILGQIESRMVQADRLILAGLNEGVWPPDSGFDVWMSRDMRRRFELPSLEQKTTLTAHDFACGFCAPEVFITRSKKSGGQPTLSSRWLQRLETILLAADIPKSDWPHIRGMHYAHWAHTVRETGEIENLKRPKPCPPIDIRPTDFSVTEIEKWMRDPYFIYAKKILRLKKMDNIDEDVSVADRGTLIHDVIDEFTSQYPDKNLPYNAIEKLIEMGKAAFDKHVENPDIHGLWWPKFTRAAEWFIDHEKDWRHQTVSITSEMKKTLPLMVNNTEFTLTAKADRIEKREGNEIAVIDYKTGGLPSTADVNTGVASQLSLEVLMIDKGVFDVRPADTYRIQYWSLSGSGDGGEVREAQGTKKSAAKSTEVLHQEAYVGVCSLFETFHDNTVPYIATPDSARAIKIDYHDYALLERIIEWSVVDGGDDG